MINDDVVMTLQDTPVIITAVRVSPIKGRPDAYKYDSDRCKGTITLTPTGWSPDLYRVGEWTRRMKDDDGALMQSTTGGKLYKTMDAAAMIETCLDKVFGPDKWKWKGKNPA